MDYRGYTAAVEFDDEAGVFHGRVQHLRDVITFQATSVDELRAEFHNSVDDYLEFCERRGESPEKPYSGKVLLRMEPTLHRLASREAARSGKSLNTWLNDLIQREAGDSRLAG